MSRFYESFIKHLYILSLSSSYLFIIQFLEVTYCHILGRGCDWHLEYLTCKVIKFTCFPRINCLHFLIEIQSSPTNHGAQIRVFRIRGPPPPGQEQPRQGQLRLVSCCDHWVTSAMYWHGYHPQLNNNIKVKSFQQQFRYFSIVPFGSGDQIL